MENIVNRIRQIVMILYWKIKYGKRIKIGKNNRFRKRLKIIIEKDGVLEIGNNNFFNSDCSITCLEKITIGDNNLFGENVKIYDHIHVFNKSEENLRNKFITKPICIGNNNWICTNVVLLKNSKMNNRNVIGANVVFDGQIDSLKIVKNNKEISVKDIIIKD